MKPFIYQLRYAVKQKFASEEALNNACTGGIWFGRAPQETSEPYITFFCVDETRERAFRNLGKREPNFHVARVQFDIWTSDADPANAETIYQYLDDVLDEGELTFSDKDFLWLDSRNIGARLLNADPDAEGWRYTVDYQITAERA